MDLRERDGCLRELDAFMRQRLVFSRVHVVGVGRSEPAPANASLAAKRFMFMSIALLYAGVAAVAAVIGRGATAQLRPTRR
jgi:hypothetical protein